MEAVKRAVDGLVKEGLMLQEDGERYIEAARKKNPLDPVCTVGTVGNRGAGGLARSEIQ